MLNHTLGLNDTVPFYFEGIKGPELSEPRNFTLFASYVGSIFSVNSFHNNTIFYDFGFSTMTVIGYTPFREISFVLTMIVLVLSIGYTITGTVIIWKIKNRILNSKSQGETFWPPQKILGSEPICRKDEAIQKIKAEEGNLNRERMEKGFFKDANFWEVAQGYNGMVLGDSDIQLMINNEKKHMDDTPVGRGMLSALKRRDSRGMLFDLNKNDVYNRRRATARRRKQKKTKTESVSVSDADYDSVVHHSGSEQNGGINSRLVDSESLYSSKVQS
jgi:hypothetical protein